MEKERVLVSFRGPLPRKGSYGLVIAPRAREQEVIARGASFEALEDWTDPESIEDAAAFLGELSRAEFPNGARISKAAAYKGYELWWLNYDDLFYRECLAYTRYKRLLERLRKSSHSTLVHPPAATLFRSYLEAYQVPHLVRGAPRSFPSGGIWLQVLISLLSLPLLALIRPAILLYTGDRFDPPRDYSFRLRLVYEELRRRKLPFMECIRSLESGRTMLAHFMKRRRPVIYSHALKAVLAWMAAFFGERKRDARWPDAERTFKTMLSSAYLSRARGQRWSVAALRLLVRFIGIRAAFIAAASSRTFEEVIACRLSGISTVGILHGAASRFYNVYDFMPEYDGRMRLGVDEYGVWSEGWKRYYLNHSRIYGPEELKVSGPIRPLRTSATSRADRQGPVEVLFVAGELSVPEETLPYLRALMEEKGVSVFLTFRPYRDAFEEWLKCNDPALLEKVGIQRIFKGRNVAEDIAACDVVVGSYSTAALEAFLQMKPAIFYRTKKWGDYFGMKESAPALFAETPEELVRRVKESKNAGPAELKRLQERFFGDPRKNGSAWVVDRLEERFKRSRGSAIARRRY